jgi:hypothetical protein
MLSLLLGGSKTKGVRKDFTFFVVGVFFLLILLFSYLHFIRKIDVLPYAAISGGIFLLYIRDRFFKVEGLNMTAHLMKNAKKKQS